MAIVAGIDEAGLGPILGPLVVSASVFGAPDELADADFWQILSPQIAQKASKKSSAIAIGDSKKLFSHKKGTLINLEKAVLSAFAITNTPDGKLDENLGLRQFVSALCPEAACEIDNYPWYKGADTPLPVDISHVDINICANALADALSQNNMALLGAASRILNAGNYNANILKTDNKAVTVGDQTWWLLDWVWRNRPAGENVYVFIDRQGGREKYLNILRRIYPDSNYSKVLIEEKDHSGYRLDFGSDHLEVHFMTKGETRKLPIALASMTAKYTRELYMNIFNNWWAGKFGDDYKPTAGYYTDAMRFLAETEQLRKTIGIDENLLIRSR